MRNDWEFIIDSPSEASLSPDEKAHVEATNAVSNYFLQRTDEYHAALEAADRAWVDSDQDLQQPLNLHSLEMLIADALSSQLQS